MEEQMRAAIAAITAGFVELVGVLAQRGVIDKGDVQGVFAIMQHTLRHPGCEQGLQQMQTWFERVVAHAPDNLPLPPG